MKYIPTIAGVLLGLIFLLASVPVLLHVEMKPPADLPQDALTFMGVFASSGWMMVIKVLECLGGLLVMVPRTRNLGLLILGPIIFNIICVTVLLMGGPAKLLAMPPLGLIAAILALFLLFCERRAWLALVAKNRTA